MYPVASASTSYGFGKDGYAYDVFINKRGPDVKKGLASHLYHSLRRHGLRVFLDMEELQAGEHLEPQIEAAIMTASVHVAIFSPQFAESPWCLDELVLMLMTGKTIIPVFYNVNPQSLRALSMKTTIDDQARHDSHTIKRWTNALSDVAEIRGFELEAYNGDEELLVEEVVKQVLTKVAKPPLFVAKYPTGLDNEVENFERTVLSQQKGEKTIVAGIVGIAGVGKTTLAKELFNRHRSNYDGSCFLFDVREHAAKGSLNVLQRKLLEDLARLDVDISSTDEGVETLKMHLPSSQRVLVVIDDVDHISQLEALVSPIQDTIHSSSLILVTSRDKDPLQTYGILDSFIYKQTGLNQQHSRELFCLHAFHQPYPPTEFEQMVEQYLDVSGGLPLSLKVIGALLYGRCDLHYWDAQLRKMSKLLSPDIQRTLEISYDSLGYEEKQIFLDAACFLIGEERDTAIRIWEGSRWKGWLGLRNLEDKCMLAVDSKNRIRMHDHLRDLGRYIAKREIPHRLWRSEDIVFDHSAVRGISMAHGTDPEESFEIPTEIRGLELLRVHGTSVERIFNNAQSPQLVWLSWYSCPFSSLPSWISVKNLRVLHIEGEKLETLWQDQSEPPLELRELDIDANILNVPKSIGMLKYLEKFVLRRRKNCDGNAVDLKTLPGEICGMDSLKHLELVGCKNITLLPDSVEKWTDLQFLVLGGCSALQGLPYSTGKWTSLRQIDLGGCYSLRDLPDSAGNWTSLQQIDLGRCSSLQGLPDSAGEWKSLQWIDLGGCSSLNRLPDSAGNWKSLQRIDLGGCSALQGLPESAGNWMSLQRIDLGGCTALQGFPDSAGNWTSLQRIDLGGCSALQWLPDSAGNWTNLEVIDLRECSALQDLPVSAGNWTSLKRINLGGCSALQRLPDSASNWTSLKRINLGGCSALQLLENLAWSRTPHHIDLTGCSALQGLPDSKGNYTNLEYSLLEDREEIRALPHASSASTASTSISNYSSASASASASATSTSISNYVYDVFINCHGPDVKRTFANHLYHRLVSYGLRPFVDEERHKEDNIGTQIKEAIATASVHVAIFSLRYAESRRCLDELLLVLASGAPVIPVFYTVKRLDLQKTKDKDGVYAGVFGRTLQNHEKGTTYDSQASGEKPRDMSNTIEEWREALHRISVPEISGFELEEFKDDEAELLDAVVKSVLKSVRKAPFYEVKYLKGLDQKVEDFENTVLLHRQSGKPQVVGIVGVAGVGKTTLAKELINRKSSSFNRTCFLFDVSGTVARSSLHFLQSKLFKELTNMNIQIESVTQGIELFTKHFSSIHGATAFVILDNVDDVHQLEALLPVQKLLPSKSLIVITSRFKDVLILGGVEQSSIYSLTDLSLDKHPSGLDGKVKALTKKLQQQSEEPQVLGIVGIGGIGKTRLAMEFFNRKSSDYTRSYFLYDVNETARTSFTLHNLQSKLLQGLAQLDLQVQGVDEGIELFKEHVSYFRSLVILDNVDHWDQLNALLSVLTVLPSGSLILVTCREAEVLKRSGVQESSIYELDPLNNEDSLELFCTYAFGKPSPGHEFEDLAEKFVRACNGLPLTLKVFGALLCGKSNSYWQKLFHKFHRIHPDQIQKSLQLCYDELNKEEQKIFLHIACSCIGAKRDFAIRLWDASGSRGLSVFESLQKRCLVDVDREDCIIMHELLVELGRTIADEKGLRRPPRPRRENDSDLFRRSSIIREVRMIVILVMAMMIWNMWPRN